jgi:predicted enzyme related to lactoylglutathione lyase
MAAANYSSLLGWSFSEKVDLGHLGTHQRFAFAKSESSIGVISGVEDRPNVHPHWLFFFTVSSLDIALQRVRTLGGTAMGPIELPNGVRVAVCDDVQGATFGIIENDDAAKLVRAR